MGKSLIGNKIGNSIILIKIKLIKLKLGSCIKSDWRKRKKKNDIFFGICVIINFKYKLI